MPARNTHDGHGQQEKPRCCLDKPHKRIQKGSYRCMRTSSSGWRMYIHGDRVTYPHGKRSLVHIGHTLGRHVDMETLGKIRETSPQGLTPLGFIGWGDRGTRDMGTWSCAKRGHKERFTRHHHTPQSWT